jgi:hypothetical protein
VLRAVSLDDQPFGEADEVGDVGFDHLLPTEFVRG